MVLFSEVTQELGSLGCAVLINRRSVLVGSGDTNSSWPRMVRMVGDVERYVCVVVLILLGV